MFLSLKAISLVIVVAICLVIGECCGVNSSLVVDKEDYSIYRSSGSVNNTFEGLLIQEGVEKFSIVSEKLVSKAALSYMFDIIGYDKLILYISYNTLIINAPITVVPSIKYKILPNTDTTHTLEEFEKINFCYKSNKISLLDL